MDKLENLKKIIMKYDSAVIAFSGGVDSTFLARISGEILDDKLLLVTAASCTYPASELAEAKHLASVLGLKHRIINTEELDIPAFAQNTPDRCYLCKHELFTKIKKIALEENYSAVFEGGTVDDLSDYRPGRRAIRELGVISPLLEAGLTKKEIRAFSEKLNLPTAHKPPFACLASRFPYGESITPEKLGRVEKAEAAIRELGFRQVRVRSHNDLARIEVATEEIDAAWSMREKIDKVCRDAGFIYAAIDLRGYRTGSMNEALSTDTVRFT